MSLSNESDFSLSERPYVYKPKLSSLSFQNLAKKKREQEEMDYYIGMYQEDYQAPPQLALVEIETKNSTDSSVPPVVITKKKKLAKDMTRWQQMKSLMRDYNKELYRVLQGVYECDAQNEPNAKDGSNIKGNKWIKFHDHAFGGGDVSHGLIKSFPLIEKPILCKKKILQIWEYAKDNKESIPKDIYDICVEQSKTYEDAMVKEKEAKVNESSVVAKLNEDMMEYEVERKGLPLGVEPTC
jgi:hypothetical protein